MIFKHSRNHSVTTNMDVKPLGPTGPSGMQDGRDVLHTMAIIVEAAQGLKRDE